MKKEKLLEYIKLGIKIEKEGIRFYSSALKKVHDQNSKYLLKFLVKQEEKHLKYFTDIIDSLKKDKKIDSLVKKFREIKIKSPIFTKKDYKRMKKKKISAFHIFKHSIEIEENSYKLYMKIAKKTNDKKLQSFLKRVAGEELKHKKLIKMHSDALYNYWYWEGIEPRPLES